MVTQKETPRDIKFSLCPLDSLPTIYTVIQLYFIKLRNHHRLRGFCYFRPKWGVGQPKGWDIVPARGLSNPPLRSEVTKTEVVVPILTRFWVRFLFRFLFMQFLNRSKVVKFILKLLSNKRGFQ